MLCCNRSCAVLKPCSDGGKPMSERIKVLTWHVHSSYLLYLTQADCDFYLPVMEGKYAGRGSGTWGDNVHDVSAAEVKSLELDCILFQNKENYLSDQYEVLS